MNEDAPDTPAPTAGAALEAAVTDLGNTAAAADAAAASSLASTIDSLVDSIKAGKAKIDAAVASTPRAVEAPAVAAPAAPAFTPETLATLCEQKGLPRETADVLVEFAKNVIAPVYVNQITQAAKTAKREAERDTTPLYDGGPTLGSAYKRYKGRIDQIAREQGVTDAYIAEHGYEKLIRLAAAEDPKFLEERVEIEVKKRTATPAPQPGQPTPTAQAAPAGPPRPPVEGAAPAMPTLIRREPGSREEQIAQVEVSREEVDRNRAIWGMTEKDTKEQKFEIARWEKELGPIGIMQAGGVPVCDIEDVFNHPTNPVREVNR